MRYSIDAHAIGRHLTGNEVYVRNLLEGFASLDPSAEFIAYLSVPGSQQYLPDGMAHRWVSNNPFARLGWQLARRVRQDQPNLLHVQYTAPLGCPVPVVAAVHDVSYLEHPEFFPKWRQIQLRNTVARTVRNAAKIVTLSQFSRQRIAEHYHLDDRKIAVVPAACSTLFRPIPRSSAKAFVQGRYDIRDPFVLCVGDLQPRKNPIALIRAFEELVARNNRIAHHLVLVGQDTWYSPKVRQVAQASPFGNRIHFTGYVDDEALLQLYNACDMFIFPSLYEGFGIPLVEAMACGRAVACSNRSAMPEVVGNAARLFNPEDQGDMVRAMEEVLTQPELRARLEKRGLLNASRFSWQGTARATLALYHEVAQTAAPRQMPATVGPR